MMSLLLGVSFGTVEYGYAFYLKHAIQNAAYLGTRAAVSTGSTNTSVQSIVSASMAMAGFQSSQYTLTTSPTTLSGVTAGTSVTITVSCSWANVGITPLPSFLGGIPTNKQITCSMLMLHE